MKDEKCSIKLKIAKSNLREKESVAKNEMQKCSKKKLEMRDTNVEKEYHRLQQ